jgi:Na+/melibiose symporter-like transporter
MEQDYDRSFTLFYNPAFIICWLAIVIFLIAAQWKVFTKAGQPGWACIVPFYNIYIMTKIGGKPWWWIFLVMFIPFVFSIWLVNMISKSFGKDEGFTVGLVLLGIIFWPILGFGSAKYLGPYGDPVAFRAYQEQHKI